MEVPSSPSLNGLPDQLLLEVFGWLLHSESSWTGTNTADLNRLPLVCKRFNELLRQPLPLWNSLFIGRELLPHSPALPQPSTSFCAWLHPRRAAVRRLFLGGLQQYPGNPSSRQLIVGLLAPTLQFLWLDFHLQDGLFGAQIVLDQLACCHKLTELRIFLHEDPQDGLSWAKLSLECLRSLTSLSKLVCRGTSGASLCDVPAQVSKLCPWLHSLTCSPSGESVTALSVLNQLEELELWGGDKSWSLSSLDSLTALSKLELVQLQQPQVSQSLSFQLPNLRSLHFTGCCLQNLLFFSILPSLQHLQFERCYSVSLEYILPALPSLTSLSLIGHLTSAVPVPNSVSSLSSLRQLECFNAGMVYLPRLLYPLQSLTMLKICDTTRHSRHAPFLLHATRLSQLSALQVLEVECVQLHVQGSLEETFKLMPSLQAARILSQCGPVLCWQRS